MDKVQGRETVHAVGQAQGDRIEHLSRPLPHSAQEIPYLCGRSGFGGRRIFCRYQLPGSCASASEGENRRRNSPLVKFPSVWTPALEIIPATAPPIGSRHPLRIQAPAGLPLPSQTRRERKTFFASQLGAVPGMHQSVAATKFPSGAKLTPDHFLPAKYGPALPLPLLQTGPTKEPNVLLSSLKAKTPAAPEKHPGFAPPMQTGHAQQGKYVVASLGCSPVWAGKRG